MAHFPRSVSGGIELIGVQAVRPRPWGRRARPPALPEGRDGSLGELAPPWVALPRGRRGQDAHVPRGRPSRARCPRSQGPYKIWLGNWLQPSAATNSPTPTQKTFCKKALAFSRGFVIQYYFAVKRNRISGTAPYIVLPCMKSAATVRLVLVSSAHRARRSQRPFRSLNTTERCPFKKGRNKIECRQSTNLCARDASR